MNDQPNFLEMAKVTMKGITGTTPPEWSLNVIALSSIAIAEQLKRIADALNGGVINVDMREVNHE